MKPSLPLGIVVLLLLGAPAAAQETRAAKWQKLREDKRQTVQPHRDTELTRTLLRVEKSGFAELTQLGVKGLYPFIGTTVRNSGFGGGARYWRPRLGGTQASLQGFAALSHKLYQFYGFQLGKMKPNGVQAYAHPLRNRSLFDNPFEETRLERRNLFLYLDLQYRDMLDEPFFGLGNDAPPENESSYAGRAAAYEVAAAYHYRSRVGIGLRGGFMQMKLRETKTDEAPDIRDVFDDTTAPGLARQPDFWHFGGSLWIDYLDHPTHPRLGGFLTLQLDDYNDRGSRGFHFHRFRLESRHYLPLLSRQRLLAVRFLTTMDTPRGANRVPFYLMESLGGNDRLRGYSEVRFRDRNLIYLSAEYRWLPAPAWELAIFYDTGKVFPDRSSFEFNHLKKNWGFGVRFRNPNQVFIRLDFARSEESTMFHFAFSPAF